LSTTADGLRALGHDVRLIEPNQFRTFPCPTYPEIRLAWLPYGRVSGLLEGFSPDAIHIATEGTLGAAARKWCLRRRFPFTISYHTQFPEYVRARVLPLAVSYAHLRRFHSAAARTMVATPALQRLLDRRRTSKEIAKKKKKSRECFLHRQCFARPTSNAQLRVRLAT